MTAALFSWPEFINQKRVRLQPEQLRYTLAIYRYNHRVIGLHLGPVTNVYPLEFLNKPLYGDSHQVERHSRHSSGSITGVGRNRRPLTDTQVNDDMTYEREQSKHGIARERLFAQLDRGLGSRLTLVTGRKPSDATQLLRDWAKSQSIPTVTVDSPPHAPCDCLGKIGKALYHAGLLGDQLDPRPDDPAEHAMADLINALAWCNNDIVLIIDGYEPTPMVDALLSFLLEYQPPQLHLYIVSESRPDIASLPRWRVRRQLVEIDLAELSRATNGHALSQAPLCGD